MKKEKFSEAIAIRLIVSFLILTALCLKAVAKLKSALHKVRTALHPQWVNEKQLVSSNRQSNP